MATMQAVRPKQVKQEELAKLLEGVVTRKLEMVSVTCWAIVFTSVCLL